MFIIPSIDLSMKLSLSEVFVSNIIVTMVISNKSCCKHVLFTNLSDFISTTTRVTSVKSKKFLFCSLSVAKFGIAPRRRCWQSTSKTAKLAKAGARKWDKCGPFCHGVSLAGLLHWRKIGAVEEAVQRRRSSRYKVWRRA